MTRLLTLSVFAAAFASTIVIAAACGMPWAFAAVFAGTVWIAIAFGTLGALWMTRKKVPLSRCAYTEVRGNVAKRCCRHVAFQLSHVRCYDQLYPDRTVVLRGDAKHGLCFEHHSRINQYNVIFTSLRRQGSFEEPR